MSQGARNWKADLNNSRRSNEATFLPSSGFKKRLFRFLCALPRLGDFNFCIHHIPRGKGVGGGGGGINKRRRQGEKEGKRECTDCVLLSDQYVH